jgi:hypothetical protein
MKATTYYTGPDMTGTHLAAAAAAWLCASRRLLRVAVLVMLEGLVTTSKAGALVANHSRMRRRF